MNAMTKANLTWYEQDSHKRIAIFNIHVWSWAVHILTIVVCSYGVFVALTGSYRFDRIYIVSSLYISALASIVLYLFGVLSDEVIFSRRLYLRRIVMAWAVVVGITLSVLMTFGISGDFAVHWARWWLVSTTLVLAFERVAFMLLIRHWVRQGYMRQRYIIVGTGPNGQRLVRHLREHGDVRTSIVGFVDDRRRDGLVEVEECPVLGTTRDLVSMIRADKVDRVIVALPLAARRRVGDLVRQLRAFPVDIFLAPDLAAFDYPFRRLEQLGGVPMVHALERPISGWAQLVKSIEDKTIAVLGLLLLAPLLAAIALAVKLDSRGPALFRQKRYGFNNKIIVVTKFRTMYVEASDQIGRVQTVRGDPRVTRIGRILRRTSVDELPQLFDVLRGDLSVVGPRPHAVGTRAGGQLFEDIVGEYAARHRVKPGITGWAQIHGWRGETDTVEKLQRRIEYDLFYIENWSVWLDITILARTIPSLWSKNAY